MRPDPIPRAQALGSACSWLAEQDAKAARGNRDQCHSNEVLRHALAAMAAAISAGNAPEN